ncbi:MAG: MerR family transcriptional regulator [Chitinophagaceae bacterium]|nr:MerR family transcriptional regulator [Chitinophagaceae bacterium]
MNSFSIKDLESLSGIKAHTIRIWEQRYSFLKPQRTTTNIRSYTCDELKTILNIALLNKYGFKISHIDKMNGDEIADKLVSLTDSQARQEKLINDLIGSTIDMCVDNFELILDDFIKTKGIEKTISQLIFPFLERIGLLWQTNNINPAQEHLVTNVIRQKLIVGIDHTVPLINVNRSVLLFLPEGEYHELGLLYMFYVLKGRGIEVLYLGANVPVRDVIYVANMKKPNELYTHITCVPGNMKLEKYLNQLPEQVPHIPVIITGQLAQSPTRTLSPHIQLKKTMQEVISHFAQS